MKTIPLKMHLLAYKGWILGERELHLLPYLCKRDKNSIDIGANIGVYTYFIKKYSKFCYAFEPNPRLIEQLNKTFFRDVKVLPYPLSNMTGIVELCIPYKKNKTLDSLGSIETNNKLRNLPCKTIKLQSKKLDDFNCKSVGFIKIDVEGHELAVLEGVRNLIINNEPNILIEIEDRHKPGSIKSVRVLFEHFGYSGYFLLKNKLEPIEQFDAESYQNIRSLNELGTNVRKGNLYINNFVFLPEQNIHLLNEKYLSKIWI